MLFFFMHAIWNPLFTQNCKIDPFHLRLLYCCISLNCINSTVIIIIIISVIIVLKI